MKRLISVLLCVAIGLAIGFTGEAKAVKLGNKKINYYLRPTATPEVFVSSDIEFVSARWKTKNDDLLFNVRVKNTSDATIDAFDLIFYGENAYGETIYPNSNYSQYLTASCDIKVKAGKTKDTGYYKLEGLKKAKKIHVAVTRYHIDDEYTVQCGYESSTDELAKYEWFYWDID